MLPLPGGRRLVGSIVAAFAILALSVLASALPASAASEPFTVRDLPVDAQAKSATDARNLAIAKGEREAYQLMLSKVALGDEASRLPPLDDAGINALIEGFEIADERVAPTRYRANLTVAFNESLVKAMLKSNGIRFVESAGRPVVVIPILVTADGPHLWQDDNVWLHAWSVRDRPPGLTPIIVPLGDTADIAELDAARASGADSQAVLQFAKRYGADEALVLEARPHDGAISLAGRHLSAGGVTNFVDEVRASAGQSTEALYAAAAERVIARLDSDVKSTAELRSGTINTVRVVAPVADLAEWISLRATLTGLSLVQTVEVIALARSGVDMVVHFYGDQAQLDAALAEHHLLLRPNGPDGSFVLAPQQAGSAVVGSRAPDAPARG